MVESLDRSLSWAAGTDPVSQASLWVPEQMYPWQCKVLYDCMVQGSRVACVTPNESGKTSVVVPVMGLSWMAAFPGAQVVSTAGVERQITTGLWPILRATLSGRPAWRITEDLRITAPSIRGLPGSTWEAFTTKDPEYAEGFHPRFFRDEDGVQVYAPLLVIIDEAKTFQGEQGHQMIRTFVKRCSPDALLMISTPGEDDGPFYDAFHSEKDKPWKIHEIGWHDCPHLLKDFKLEEREQSLKDLGKDHPFNQSWIYGKFYRRGARFVFDSTEDVDRAMSGMVRQVRGDRYMALDFSGGGDEQVLGIRDGNRVMPLEGFHERDTTRLVGIFIDRFKRWNMKPENIIADNGGLGKPIIDQLESKGWGGIRRYMFNDKPSDSSKFASRGTEDHYELKFLLQQGAVSLPNDDKLREQMRKRRYVMAADDSNKIRVEPKEKVRNRGEPSPDRLDVAVMLFSQGAVMGTVGAPERKVDNTMCGLYTGCFKQVEREDSVFPVWGEL